MLKNKKIIKSEKKTKKTKKINLDKIIPSLEEMLKAGVHFGHRTSKWHAKMSPYIFTTRNNVHIFDLEKTEEKLRKALEFLHEIKKKKGIIIFVGTKVAVKEITQESAKEIKMPYINERWIGGTLTNFEVISKRLKHIRDLEKRQKEGELKKYTKKEQHDFNIEIQKLNRQFGGIKEITKLPEALLVIDVYKEKLAVKEAKMKGIPVVGLCDTNANPTDVDYPIPVNDDAISSLKLILGAIVKVLK
ncbi:MAG: 30S ribosomal protein S2 [Patescibacteria group bacterium]